jgi:uncharacterized damage-inducible protein DinB
MKRFAMASFAALLVAGPLAVAAQAPTGIRADLLAQFDDASSKLSQLADAIGQDKYGWRPGTGVRSVSEVLMHVVGANYYLLTFAGIQPAQPLARDAETTVTDKAQVGAALKASYDHVRNAIRNLKEADLDKPVTMFGQQTTMRNVYLTTVTHAHEHLGQLIAYARSNGIVPPWSRGM